VVPRCSDFSGFPFYNNRFVKQGVQLEPRRNGITLASSSGRKTPQYDTQCGHRLSATSGSGAVTTRAPA
jgi:hypothetical protein